MDRLSAVIIALGALTACESKQEEPLPGRANVGKSAQKSVDTKAFCDVQFDPGKGPKLTVPKLLGGTLAESAPTWRWINIWATWCKPCVDEMPRLLAWREKLGAKFELSFVSVDENEADLADFHKAYPATPASPRLAEPAKASDWYVSLGLDGGAPVPIHVFVEPSGHVRCARAGGVREKDFPAIEKLLAQ